MAKRQRIERRSGRSAEKRADESDATIEQATVPSVPPNSSVKPSPYRFSHLPNGIAIFVLASVLVYSQYHPSDSVAVEQGDGLWFAAFSLVVLIANSFAKRTKAQVRNHGVSLVLDWVPWLLAGWMMIAAFGSSPPGNLRLATNEAWIWVSAAAVFFAARRLFAQPMVVRGIVTLLFGCAVAQAVHGLHQQFISLPQMRAAYEANPEPMLLLAGIDAPPGSSERIVFENRLRDGGPTGTFALANSLAGVLVVGIMIAISGLWFQGARMSVPGRVCWVGLIALLVIALLATRSRSAVVAIFIGAAILLIMSANLGRHRRTVFVALAAIASVAAIVGGGILTWGNREWIEQAPASLAFRIQYWRSTIAMVTEMPLFGAGPGNYQMIYERFREPSANEQIAEPHNFFFETLASGGWIAAGLLICLAVAVAVCWRSRRQQFNEADGNVGPAAERWWNAALFVWLGAAVSFLLVWIIGFIVLRVPDIEADLFGVPLCIAAMVVAWKNLRRLSDRDLHSLGAAAILAMLVHLSIAGGWTVPGVAICVWLMTAVLCRAMSSSKPVNGGTANIETGKSEHRVAVSDPASRYWRERKWSILGSAASVLLLGASVWMSILPVSHQQRLLSEVSKSRGRTNFQNMDALLSEAMAADPWSAEAVRWRADAYRWEIVRAAVDDDAAGISRRSTWQSLVEQAKQRAGQDPSAYRELGTAQLHVFQRFGRQEDLQNALSTFAEAETWSPSNQWMAAQFAEVLRAAGNSAQATEMAQRAQWLSGLRFTMDRMLESQMILEARPIGVRAAAEPKRRPASELLMNQLGQTDVP
ncbi:O-antigen ligase family protein [Novipirellula sp. SH528]|uniref:O-antigen ligase family protein n=1 Tax=Novipirellula sp. SH528 TaxID=3454466 RepID=UPI003F9F63E6